MLHIFWTYQLSALINMKLPHTKIHPATALCSRPPILMYLGHFWHAASQPEGEQTHMYNRIPPPRTSRVWFWCSCIKQQHLSARSFSTLQEWYHPLTSVISLPVIQMDSYTRSTHVWKSPAHPSFDRESRIYSAAREIVDFSMWHSQ